MKRLILVFSGIGAFVWVNRGYGAWIEGGNPIPSAFTNMVVYDTPGTYIFTVPDGVYKIKVELWGGGGGGNYQGSYTCGGGGGGYGMAIIDVTPSSPCAITVGNGGGTGANGENTTVTCGAVTYTAYGGGGATVSGGECRPGVGGSSNAPFSIKGESGGREYYNSSYNYYRYWGANAGASPRGGFGGNGYYSFYYDYRNGTKPGGGGWDPSGRGAPGRVVIWY